MQIVYAHERARGSLARSIFLAGPSPRSAADHDWRKEAIRQLYRFDFTGTVFVPLPSDGVYHETYDHRAQVFWELEYLEKAAVRAFWVPRNLKHLPGYTTNVEFGRFSRLSPCVLGYPPEAPGMRYLAIIAEIDRVAVYRTLEDTLRAAILALPPE